MATFNFSSGTAIINSKMSDVIYNIELASTSGAPPQKDQLLHLIEIWHQRGLPEEQYFDLKQSICAASPIGRNEKTRSLFEKIAAIATTTGAIAETYTGIAAILASLRAVVS